MAASARRLAALQAVATCPGASDAERAVAARLAAREQATLQGRRGERFEGTTVWQQWSGAVVRAAWMGERAMVRPVDWKSCAIDCTDDNGNGRG
jgi:hypothetical protein